MVSANATRETDSRFSPPIGIGRNVNAAVVRLEVLHPVMEEGFFCILVMMTSPVTAHMITVSQKTAVIEIRACLRGLFSEEEAAAIAAVPIPASLVKSPLAMPYLAALIMVLPIKPPAAAFV